MWNRQREADKARELLAEVGDEVAAPDREPSAEEEVVAPNPTVAEEDLISAADAAE
jgi:ATP-binding cassette subfamily B protein